MLTAAVNGTGPFAYQWSLSGTALPGQTNVSLLLPNVQTIHQGNYQLVVTNLAGRAVSALATLNVNGPPSFQIPRRMPDASVQLGLAGIPNHTYVIEVSSDLRNWSPLLPSFVYTNGIMTFSDPGAVGAPSRFYRAKEQ
jgi:hypothetical protein